MWRDKREEGLLWCGRCKRLLPIEEFTSYYAKLGNSRLCRECRKVMRQRYATRRRSLQIFLYNSVVVRLHNITRLKCNQIYSIITVGKKDYFVRLKKHIEREWKKGMTWDNHGEWHVDHVYPVSRFSKETPVSEVCALDNLQPLWGPDNLSKSNKI